MAARAGQFAWMSETTSILMPGLLTGSERGWSLTRAGVVVNERVITPARHRTRAGTSSGSRAACDGLGRLIDVPRSAERLPRGGTIPGGQASRVRVTARARERGRHVASERPGCRILAWGGSGPTTGAYPRPRS